MIDNQQGPTAKIIQKEKEKSEHGNYQFYEDLPQMANKRNFTSLIIR